MGRRTHHHKHRYMVTYETKGDDDKYLVRKIDFVTDVKPTTRHQMETMEILISTRRENNRPVIIVAMELATSAGRATQPARRGKGDPADI